MGVISFSRPQDGLEQIQKAVDLLTLIHEVARDPSMGKTISTLSDQLTAAQELSDEKKKEVADAQEIIAQSKEFLEDFEKEKQIHVAKIKLDLQDIENKNREHQIKLDNYERDKTKTQAIFDKAKQDAEEKLAQAKKFYDEATSRSTKAQQLEKDLSAREQNHLNTVSAFETDKAKFIADADMRDREYAGGVQKLAEECKVFEQRKKKFEDALKG